MGEKPNEEWNILQGLRISPHKILITKNKKETLQWKKYSSLYLNQTNKFNFTSSGTNWHQVPPKIGCNKYSTTSGFFLPKIFKLNLILRKHETSPIWGTLYKTPGVVSSEIRSRKYWVTIPDWRRVEQHVNKIPRIIWFGFILF